MEFGQEELRIQDERERDTPLEMLEQSIAELELPPIKCMDVSDSVGDAIRFMQNQRFGATVITREGKIAGILTERDLLMKAIGQMDDFEAHKVTEIMTPDPERLHVQDKVVYVLNLMHMGGFRHVPIVDDDDVPIHMVAIANVVAHILEPYHHEIVSIPPAPPKSGGKQYSG